MNKKEYTIKINGITTSVKEVTSLEKALQSLDKTAKSTSVTPAAKSAGSSGASKTKAVTEEEKAVKKLADTQKKLTEVNNEANRAQIEATQQLRERTREVSREIALNGLAEGSIASMGMELTNLRNEYENLSEAERDNIAVGGQMITKIQALDADYKELRESTGNFRDSVGNYEKGLAGLNKLDKGLGYVGSTVNGLSSAFASNSAMMGIFGSVTEGTEKAQSELAKIIALVTIAQQLSTAATGQNSAATIINTAITKVNTAQTKAKAIAEGLAAKGTIAATIAQRAFNLVAYANPYVLLAMALVGLVAALVIFSSNTDDAADSQKKLNEEQKVWLDFLDSEAASLKLVSDARVNALQRQLDLLKAQEGKSKETRKTEDEIYREKLMQNARLIGIYHNEVEALEQNRAKLALYYEMMRNVQLAQARGDNKMYLDIDLNGKAEKVKVEEAVDIVQAKVDNLNRQVELAVKLKTEEADLLAAPDITKALREKEDKEEAKRRAEEAKRRAEEAKRKAEEARKNAQERAALELEAQRAAEDLRIKLMGQSLEAQKKLIRVEYERQIQDLRIRLKQEENLSTKARSAINDQIIKLEQVKNAELEKLQNEIAEKEIETARLLQDQQTALLKGMHDRRIAEIDIMYDRQIEDVMRRLRTEKDLTEQQRKDLNQMVLNYDKQRMVEMDALIVEGLNRRAALEVQTAEDTLRAIQNKIGEVVSRQKGGVFDNVINPGKTKANLAEVNGALSKYVADLIKYQADLKIAHDATIAGLKVGSIEYDEEMQKYAATTDEVAAKIAGAEKAQKENSKLSTQTTAQYYSEMFGKISEYADIGAQALTSVFDTLNMGIQASLDSLNEQLETTNEHYEEAKEKREKYAEDVEAIEAQVQNATGATADALRDQLQNAMHARDEAAREEQRLAKEKEKLEADIAKKEKQMKRNDLMGKMATGIANTAQGVTQALTLPWPLNLFMAGVVGVMGAAQVGIMAKQLTKLAKGGPIVGPSHTNGGVNILIDGKPSYEAQGGEFMVNDRSYGANKSLVSFINDSPQTLTAADLVGIVPGFDAIPVAVNDIQGGNNNSDVVDAINDMEFNPVVSVTDIINVTDEVTTVRDLAGI